MERLDVSAECRRRMEFRTIASFLEKIVNEAVREKSERGSEEYLLSTT
jgi:hypothetical protein